MKDLIDNFENLKEKYLENEKEFKEIEEKIEKLDFTRSNFDLVKKCFHSLKESYTGSMNLNMLILSDLLKEKNK